MPTYEAKAYLLHNGKLVKPEETLELTEEQAERLNEAEEKVAATEKAVLTEKTVPELKEIAKEKGLEGYSEMKKAELIEALKEE